MPRPRKHRCCRRYAADRVYKPRGIPMRSTEVVEISLDQFEALRLCDSEGLDQDQAGQRMGVSRGTIQRLLYRARKAMIDAIVDNRALIINLKSSEASHVVLHSHERGRRVE